MLISFYLMPQFLFNVAIKAERHERKSTKEESLLSKNITYLMLGSLIFPMVASSFYSMIHFDYNKPNPYEEAPKYPAKPPSNQQLKLFNNRIDNAYNEFFALSIANSSGLVTRFTLQFGLVMILY